MRVVIVDIESRKRPKLITPSKGSVGDLTNESQRPLTDVDYILRRYAGNLAELNAWKSSLKYGDQSALPDDLVDAFNVLKDAHDAFDNLQDNPFSSFDDAMSAIADGTFLDKIAKTPGEKTDDKTDNGGAELNKIAKTPGEKTDDKTDNGGAE